MKRMIYTKEQVYAMTASEIAENVVNILRSMRAWEKEEQEKVKNDGEME